MTLLPGESQKPLERGSDDGKLELHSLTAPKPQGPGAAGEFLGKPPIYTAALESSLEPQGSLAWGRVAGNPPKAGLVFLDFLVSKNVQRMDLATGGSATERVTGWMSAQQPPRGDLMDRGASPPFQGPPAPPGSRDQHWGRQVEGSLLVASRSARLWPRASLASPESQPCSGNSPSYGGGGNVNGRITGKSGIRYDRGRNNCLGGQVEMPAWGVTRGKSG